MKYLVIIPTYNESENIEALLESIFSIEPDIYVCVVDDNSPDGTGQLVDALLSKYSNLFVIHRPRKQGLGPAYIEAFQKNLNDTSIDYVIMMDADFSHDPKYLPEILKQSIKYDLVIGSRYVVGGGISHWGLWRRILSRLANIYVRAILQQPINDWTGGYNCVKTTLLRRVDLSQMGLSGYAFISELKYLLMKAGAHVIEVPIIFTERREGISKISSDIIFEGVLAPWKIKKQKTK